MKIAAREERIGESSSYKFLDDHQHDSAQSIVEEIRVVDD
jgi:hypothetical protein